jgi:hypothetical protein
MEDRPLYAQYTVEKAPAVSSQKVMLTVGLTVLLVLCMNGIMYFLVVAAPQNSLDFSQWYKLLHQEAPSDVLILGDSTAYLGIDEEQFGEEVGLSAVNVATNVTWGLSGDAWMLEAYIERYGPPSYVVIVHTPHALAVEISGGHMASLETIPGYRYSREFRATELPLLEWVKVAVLRYLPFYSQIGKVQTYLSNPTAYTIDGALSSAESIYQRQLNITRSEEEVWQETEDIMAKWGYADGLTVSEQSRWAMKTIASLAEQYNLPVYVFSAPYYVGVQEDAVFQAYYADFVAAVARWDSSSPYVTFVDEQVYLCAECMADMHHTNRIGQALFTSALADSFRRSIGESE